MTSLNCPYCDVPFLKFPIRKSKCKACGEVVYPRRPPGAPKDVRILMTEEQADVNEKAWQTDQLERELDQYLRRLSLTWQNLEKFAPDATSKTELFLRGTLKALPQSEQFSLNTMSVACSFLREIAFRDGLPDLAIEFSKRDYYFYALQFQRPNLDDVKLDILPDLMPCPVCAKRVGFVGLEVYLREPFLPTLDCEKLYSSIGRGCLKMRPFSDRYGSNIPFVHEFNINLDKLNSAPINLFEPFSALLAKPLNTMESDKLTKTSSGKAEVLSLNISISKDNNEKAPPESKPELVPKVRSVWAKLFRWFRG